MFIDNYFIASCVLAIFERHNSCNSLRTGHVISAMAAIITATSMNLLWLR